MAKKIKRKGTHRQPQSEHLYGERFMLMHYFCRDCEHRVAVWNSRNGVTPFFLGCRCDECEGCGGMMMCIPSQDDYYTETQPDGVKWIFYGPGDEPKIKRVK